jgi:hypothetical protein
MDDAIGSQLTLYWSATVYDRAAHALIRDLSWPSRSSKPPGLQTNGDGPVDVNFGPQAGVSLFADGNLSPGLREDRGNH